MEPFEDDSSLYRSMAGLLARGAGAATAGTRAGSRLVTAGLGRTLDAWTVFDAWAHRARIALGRAQATLRRVPAYAWVLAVVVATVLGAWHELRTSALQARLLARYASRLSWEVEPGPSPSIVFPRGGPFDERRGYAEIPAFSRRLERRGFGVREQARFSKELVWLAGLGVTPPQPEPANAGLLILGSDGDTLYDASGHGGVIERYDDVPPLVVGSLLYLENRELVDPPDRRSNPVVDWRRLTKAGLLYAGHGIGLPVRIEGGSTLAIQLEKFRHSGEGQTDSPVDKLRQIVAASLRAYRGGTDTRAARRQIALDYLNTMPLAAAPGHGEVNGISEGLRVWFGRDPERTFASIANTELDPGVRARAFRTVMALLYAVRAPTHYLVRDRAALETRTDGAVAMLAAAGLIDSTFADAVRHERLRFSPATDPGRPPGPVAGKAPNLIRGQIQSLLDVPDFYALNRLNLDAESTIDVGLQREVSALFRQLGDTAFVASHGLVGKYLLGDGDPADVVYSLALYEAGPRGNMLRVHADNLDQPFDVNRSSKLELGSTAKLRTLAHYLELIAELHGALSGLDADSLRHRVRDARDPLTRWAADTLADTPDLSLEQLLDAALARRYSASPGEAFFTGGGVHTFHNFDKADDTRKFSVREAAARSNNLVFVRLMRDLVRYHQARLPYDARAVLSDRDDPTRVRMLEEVAESEARTLLHRAWKQYRGRSPQAIEQALLGSRVTSPRSLAALWYAWHPGGSREAFAAWLEPRVPGLPQEELDRLERAYGDPTFTLLDYGYLLDRHPLDLWAAGALSKDRKAGWEAIVARSTAARRLASDWLLGTRHKGAQDLRLRTRIEQDAFARMLPAWKRLGFPFDRLVPSYATAIGSSSDRPAALAELMGILVNDGVRRPVEVVSRLSFGPATAYHTTFEAEPARGDERVMAVPVARAMRSVLAGVVDHGTAARVRGAFVGRDSLPLVMGGKTGSGDNRFETFGPGGRAISSRSTSRTAAFVFYIGERHFGVITASVTGARAGHYTFTSSLPLAVLRMLAPGIQRELTPAPDPNATASALDRAPGR